jgi:transcriptional regulator with XRE-family HTH domain
LNTEKIRQLREKLDLSQLEAAKRAGLKSRQHWYNIESGMRPNITIEQLEGIAKALGVKPADLLS